MGRRHSGASEKIVRTMGDKRYFRIEAWSTRFLGTAERATALMKLLETMDAGHWAPERWNTVEPIRKNYSRDCEAEIIEAWTQDRPRGSGQVYNYLLFRRKSPRMLFFAHAIRWGVTKLNYLWIELDAKPFANSDGPTRLRSLLKSFVAWSDASYASVCYSGQSHRRIVQLTPLQRLEQIHWLNFFGTPYLALFGRERLLNALAI
jgi:hypothetical protein